LCGVTDALRKPCTHSSTPFKNEALGSPDAGMSLVETKRKRVNLTGMRSPFLGSLVMHLPFPERTRFFATRVVLLLTRPPILSPQFLRCYGDCTRVICPSLVTWPLLDRWPFLIVEVLENLFGDLL